MDTGRAVFRLICVLERGIAFARPGNLGGQWPPVCIDDSLYQARAAV